MATKTIARRPQNGTRPAPAPTKDLVTLTVDLDKLARDLVIAKYALIGMLHDAVDLQVPTEDVPAFVEPTVEALDSLHERIAAMTADAIALVRRLPRTRPTGRAT
jgi:hypothetical protein